MRSSKAGKKPTGFAKFRKDWIEPLLIAFLLAVVIKTFIIQPFKIPSASMEDTLLVGDHLVAVKFIYGTKIPFINKRILRIREPKPGDIVIFRFPENPSKDFIKRCIAVGGQTVEIRNKEVYVDGKLQEFNSKIKFIDNTIYPAHIGPRDNLPLLTIPPGQIFVMGDNRDNSNDSRYWGTVPCEAIKGKALILYWSWNKEVPLYDIVHRIRWRRAFALIK